MRIISQIDQRYKSYLTDESHLFTASEIERIYFPQTIEDIITIVRSASEEGKEITVSGGGTGIAAGRVPLSGWIIATDEMRYVEGGKIWKDSESGIEYSYISKETDDEMYLTVPIAMTLKAVQNLSEELGWFYPPDPTERSAFIGGNFATNASGSRSFKYGSTRNWVASAKIVLPNGNLISLGRGGKGINQKLIIDGIHVPRPLYPQPDTTKNVAGPVIKDNSDEIDLFIGTDGIFGITVEITLKLMKKPINILNIIAYCNTVGEALSIIKKAQEQRKEKIFPVPMSVEYLDERATKIMNPEKNGVTVILEQDSFSEDENEKSIEFWVNYFEKIGVVDTSVAMTKKEIEHHKHLRHLVPETVNSIARSNKQPKLGTDYAVPIQRLQDLFDLCKISAMEFEKYQQTKKPLNTSIGYAMWAHAGDAHVHLNFLPRDDDEKDFAKSLMVRIMQQVVKWKGTIAAEHGLGKKKFNGEAALKLMLGDKGLEQIKAMKKALDPKFLLNRGNLISDSEK